MLVTQAKTPKAATVLAVGSDEAHLQALRALLETSGYAVITATDGHEALAAARASTVDLVISDIDLPEMDGYALCKVLRADEALHGLPVILFASLTDPNEVIRGLEAGANNFLRRPFDGEYLLARVRKVLTTAGTPHDTSSALGLTIRFRDRAYNLSQERLQILDVLLSTFDDAVNNAPAPTDSSAPEAQAPVVEDESRAAARIQLVLEVNADKARMLDLLVSSYDEAVHQNRELARTRDELHLVNERLEALVADRTAELTAEIERHRDAEAARQQSEEQYRSILQTAMDGFWKMDDEGHILEANGAYARMSGYSLEELNGMRVSALDADETGAGMAAHLKQVMVTGEDRFETRHRRKDGSTFDVEVSVQYRSGKDGRFMVFARDITERRQAEELHERFRVGFEKGAVGQALTDLDGRFVRVNEALARMLGRTSAELEGAMFAAATHPDDQEIGRQAMDDLMAGGDTARFEKRYVTSTGGSVLADVNVAMVRDAAHRPQSFIATVVDVTARGLAMAESESLARFPDESPAPVLRLSGDGTLLYANRSAAPLLGYWGIEVGDPVPADWIERVSDAVLHRGLREHEVDCAGLSYVLTLRPVDRTGYINVYAYDITDRKRAEQEQKHLQEQLRSAQKLEAIGTLAGGVAHDFNNMLTVILTYTGFAIDSLSPDDPLKEDLIEARTAAERAAGLTRQLLAFGRKQVLQPVPLDLNRVTAGIESMLRLLLGADIAFVLKLSPALGNVLADPAQIEQVLMNLVVNARDAMPDGGTLTIATSNIEIDEEYAARHVAVAPGSYVQLAVSDSGCGMDPETKANIFQPFFTTKPAGRGTGLGLSTVYGIIKQSQGSIWVYSELGHGTTFKIYLPSQPGDRTSTRKRVPTMINRPTGTGTILVVDDDAALRTVAVRTLVATGYTVLCAADGEEALRVSASHAGEIDLVVTDVVMPRLNGKSLAAELAKTRPKTKILFMSGYTDDLIVHHGVLDEGIQFLAKPFTATDLKEKVWEVLSTGTTSPDDRDQPAVEPRCGQPLDRYALRALIPDLVGQLRVAVTAARQDDVVRLVESIRTTFPTVATVLRALADEQDYVGLYDLLSEPGAAPVAR